AIAIADVSAVAHQAARQREFTPLVDGRNRISRRQSDNFVALAIEERIGADQHRCSTQLNHSCERGIYLALAIRGQNMYLLAKSARRFLNFPHLVRGHWIIRVKQYGDQLSLRDKRAQQAKTLGLHLGGEQVHTGHVASGPAKARDNAKSDRVTADGK